jgi:hydroxymethylbilane synthase
MNASTRTAHRLVRSPRRTGEPLRVGTRGSTLALAQAGWLASRVSETCGRPARLVTVVTAGDESDKPIEHLGETGVFVTALRDALLRGAVDFIVHSCKDLPTAPCPGIRLAALPERADPRDALICRSGTSLAELPAGARVGTGAPRRIAQILALGYPLRCVPVRGNVDTRLRKLADGEVDALVLAAAGLSRLSRDAVVSSVFDTGTLLPAPAQGALAVECRTDDTAIAALLSLVDDPATRAAVEAERSFLAELQAGCTAPVGALAALQELSEGPMLRLDGVVAAPDGRTVLRRHATGRPVAAQLLGRDLARALVGDGAGELLGAPRPAAADPGPGSAR